MDPGPCSRDFRSCAESDDALEDHGSTANSEAVASELVVSMGRMNQMSLYLVTGGCGFIGSHLVDALIERGSSVRVLDDLSSGNRANLAPAATLVVGDVRDPDVVRQALMGVDGCFHLAAIASVARYETDWRYAHEVNLFGSINIFQQAVSAAHPIPIVYASSAAVYGEGRGLPAREDIPVRALNSYGADKAACELHASVIARGNSRPVTGLRFFNVYGPRQDPASMYSGVVSIFLRRMLRDEPIEIYGDGKQTRDFVHVSDVVEYMMRAMESQSGGIYNVCTGNPTTIVELGVLLADLCGREFRARYQPARPGDIRDSCGDPSLAVAEFGYLPARTLREGLVELISASSSGRDLTRPRRDLALSDVPRG